MAQRGIREYDAKRMFATYMGYEYEGYLIQSVDDLYNIPDSGKRVIKPDHLFGKRGKYGLLGIKLSRVEVAQRYNNHLNKEMTIQGKTDTLDTFLVEPYQEANHELYLSFATHKEYDEILLSLQGGIEIEDERESVLSYRVGTLDNIQGKELRSFLDMVGVQTMYIEPLMEFITKAFSFFRLYGCTYLEINPLAILRHKQLLPLDMVCRLDTCEKGSQKKNRSDIVRVKPFGSKSDPFEEYIESLDEKTGASLKFSLLNPEGSLRLVLGGGGASVVTMDTLSDMGLLNKVGNYGELSGNPDKDSNKEYIQAIVEYMLKQKHPKQWLCIVGGIANFTRIDVVCDALIEVISSKLTAIQNKNIHILLRRGGLNDTQALARVSAFCKKHALPIVVADGDVYLTDALAKLSF